MGALVIVATPIGNLSDLSPRALEALRSADLVACEDTRQTLKLLNHFGIRKTLVSYHDFNEDRRTAELGEKIRTGLTVALVSDAGTPGISDPGYRLVRYCREHNLSVPGDVGIIGSTGLDVAEYSHPSLTVLQQPMEAMGIEAARMLLEMVREETRRLVGRYVPSPQANSQEL